MSKILFFDVDGTLYRGDCKVPASAAKAICESAEAGNKIIICTGRNDSMIPEEVRALPYHGIIGGCGTYIEVEGKVLTDAAVEGDDCKDIMKALRECECGYYVDNPDYFYFDKTHMPQRLLNYIPEMERKYPGRLKYIEELPDKLAKITGYPTDKTNLARLKEAVSKYFDVLIHKEYEYIELILKGYSKGTGVSDVLKYYGANREDSYGFGDSANDIPMLEAVGHPVVMGDAPEEMKARYRATDSIYKDGLAKAIRDFKLV